MVKYRLKFSFKKESVELNREDNINSIISDIDCLVSDDPIRRPYEGEIIEMSGVDYRVESVKITFEKDGDVTYYDFVVGLSREPIKDEEYWDNLIQKKIEEERMKQKAREKQRL